MTATLRGHPEDQAAETPKERGWRSVFGMARPEEVEEIDRIVAAELERVDQPVAGRDSHYDSTRDPVRLER